MTVRSSASVQKEDVPTGTGTVKQVLIGPEEGPNFALRKFVMEPGGGIPLHTNAVEHEQYILGGRARLVVGDEVLEVAKDDVVFIPAGVPHAYTTLGEEPFEFLCVVPNLPDQSTFLEPTPDAGTAPGDPGHEGSA